MVALELGRFFTGLSGLKVSTRKSSAYENGWIEIHYFFKLLLRDLELVYKKGT